ncbi:lactonase family protein [Paraburkholderia tropica]|uniref:lactonase family protein n=1 Tax=Paraburkholderia tropica TaxID=92647 RepID=UPI00158FB173|nr:beta-propeller fold lactonase family protein [Paraburkholderia tropica]
MDISTTTAFVYVSNADDCNVSAFGLDSTGQLEPLASYAAGDRAMAMATSPDQGFLCAVTQGKAQRLIVWSIDARSGALNSCVNVKAAHRYSHLCFDPTGQWLIASSRDDDVVCFYRWADVRNERATPADVFPLKQAQAVAVANDGMHVYVSSLLTDSVASYMFDPAVGKFAEAGVYSLPGDFGPRNLRLSPAGSMLYILSELSGRIAAYNRDVITGKLSLHVLTGRPAALAELNDGIVRPHYPEPQPEDSTLQSIVWAADLQVTPDGRSVFTTERTSGRLLGYRVGDDAIPIYTGYVDTEPQPRSICIDPAGRFLVATGEKSAWLTVYAVNNESGCLRRVFRESSGRGANWIEMVARRSN